MAQNEVPPWEELPPHEDEDVPGDDVDIAAQLGVCDATGYVTQGQFAAMLQLVKDQRKQIDRLSVQVAGMINRNPGRPNPSTAVGGDVKHEDGVLLAGKYRGKTHDWVAMNEPDYVRYLVENNWHEKWGFTARHLEAAEKAAKIRGPRR